MNHKIVHHWHFFLIGGFVLAGGCSQNELQVSKLDKTAEYGRLEVDERELSAGLAELLGRLAGDVGSFDQQALMARYLNPVRQGLAQRGYCQIRNLHINQSLVKLDIFFRVDQSPAALTLAAYIDGKATPAQMLVNRYQTVQTAAASNIPQN